MPGMPPMNFGTPTTQAWIKLKLNYWCWMFD
jgi:hypothetical protein